MTIRQKLGIAKKKLESKITEVNMYLEENEKQSIINLMLHLGQLNTRFEKFKMRLTNIGKSVERN